MKTLHTYAPCSTALLRTIFVLLPMCALLACGDDSKGGKKWDTDEDASMNPADSSDMDGSQDQDTVQGDMQEDMAPDLGPTPGQAPPYPAAVETSVSTITLQSGETVQTTCTLLDQYGEPFEDEAVLMDAALRAQATPEDVLAKITGTQDFQAALVGTSRVACSSRKLGLVDTTPEIVTVTPGAPFRTVITLSDRTISAGSTATATCQVYDAHGNLVPDAAPSLSTDISGDGITISGNDLTITRADDYEVTCNAGAAPELGSAPLEVTPSLPASITIEKLPFQQVYGIGQVITIATYITDIYDNEITDAAVDFTSNPAGENFGQGRFRYFNEGTYTVLARVTGETQNDMELSASTQIIVNGTGPQISCDGPTDGEQLLLTPGQSVLFKGSLADTNGVQFVAVNGVPATLNPDGTFEASLTTRYGINFVDVTARDDFNAENSRTCAFQVSDNWTAPGALEPDALMLKLRQPAVDDYARSGPLSSLGDLLYTVLNSQGLIDTLDTTLRTAGPVENGNTTKLYSDSCATRILGICVAVHIWYFHDSLNVVGPSPTSLTLLQDGLNLTARINTIKIGTRLRAAGIFDTNGTVTVDYIDMDLDSNLLYQNGRPRVTLRQVNSTSVGNVSSNYSGIDGFFVNILISLFQGTVAGLLQDQLESFINDEFNATLDNLVNSLDVNSLGTTINIPKLDQSGDIPLQFNVNFSSLTATAARALFGLGASFDGPVTKGINSRGAAIPAGTAYLDPTTNKSAAVAVHVSIINQVLHALWRGGFFDGTIGQQTLGESVPQGTQVTLATGMPPMLVMKGGTKADLHIGAMSLAVIYPGVFDEPLQVTLGATARTSLKLVGESIEFGNIILDEFYFSAPGVSLDETTRDVLENFLKNLVQKIVNTSLNDALPALPIPSFTLPATLSTYGFPPNADLGLYNPTLDASERHFVLDGDFGLR